VTPAASAGIGRRLGRALVPAGRLDRYVGALFASAFVVAFLMVVGLMVIIDLSVNVDEYTRAAEDGSSPGLTTLARYYAYHVPFLYLQVAPFVTLIAGLFTVNRLVRDNELAAALSAGVSAYRVLIPIVAGGAVLAGGMFALREWTTEELGARRDALRDQLEERREEQVLEDVRLKDLAGNHVRIGSFRAGTDERPQPVIDGLEVVVRRAGHWLDVEAARAAWDGQAWRLSGGRRREIDALVQHDEPVAVLEDADFTPRDVLLAWKSRAQPLELSFAEAYRLAERDPDNQRLQTLLLYHVTFPLANVVLLLVGLPFLVRMERGRGLEGIALGFVLCLFFYGADFVARSLGMQGEIAPLLASWLPVLFFGSLGIVLYASMRS
jgi:lipopolysaccharide export system permease protein